MSVARVETFPYWVQSFPNREAWIEARKTLGVGSSESAALFSDPQNPMRGLSSWESAYSLSAKKRGLYEEKRRDDDAEHLEWSAFIEPSIAAWFAAKVIPDLGFDLTVEDPGRFTVQRDRTLPMFSTVDRFLCLRGVPQFVLELKNASEFMRDEWGAGDPPLPYQIQVQHQLSVTGLSTGFLCVSFGGGAPRWARIDRNEALIAILRKRCVHFWQTVIADQDPPVDGHSETARALTARYPHDDGTTTQLDDRHLAMWEQRMEIAAQKKKAEERYDALTNQLKAAIGEASFGQLPEGRLLSLRRNKAGRRDLKEVTQ